jgi:iron(III) transport system permease protein
MFSTRRKFLLATIVAILLISGLMTITDARELILLRNTFLLTAAVLGLSLPLGTLIGIAATRTDLPGRRALMFWLAVSLLTPLHLLAAAWSMGLGPQGWLAYWDNGWITPWFAYWPAAIFVHSAAAVPWVAWLVGSAARRCERAVEEMALLEASPSSVVCVVLLPQLRPAIAIAAILVASQVATEIAVTDFFLIRTWAEETYVNINLGGWEAIQGTQALPPGSRVADLDVVAHTWWSAAQLALAGILAVIWSLLLWLAGRAIRRATLNPVQETLQYSWGRWRMLAGSLWWIVLAAGIGFPLLNLVIKTGWIVTHVREDVYERSWSAAKVLQMTCGSFWRYRQELGTSFQTAFVAASVGLLAIVWLQWLLSKQPWWLNPGSWLAVIMLLVPGPVLGLWLISIFDHPTLTWLHPFYDRSLVVVELAQLLRIWPWLWAVVAVTFSTVGRGQLEQAELDGAGQLFVLHKILWPQLWPSWLLAWILGFELALGELAATILVSPPGQIPLSVRLFTLLHSDYEAEVAGLCLMLIFVHAVGVAGMAWLMARTRIK